MTYRWNDAVAEGARAVLVTRRIGRGCASIDRLIEVVAQVPNKVSLATLVPPLFLLALDRGRVTTSSADARRDRRACVLCDGKGLAGLCRR